MARARKLFPSYGSSLATRLLGALEREHIVADFVAQYVSAYNRSGIQGGAGRDREFAETIGREIVLAAEHQVRHVLPRLMGKKSGSALKPEEKKIIDAFFAEFHATLGRAWRWTSEDYLQFQRDANLYSDAPSQKMAKKKSSKIRVSEDDEPPFVGRVALLLDPSMLDQARRATLKFHNEIEEFVQRLLQETLDPGWS
jgi:hypothetical protein